MGLKLFHKLDLTFFWDYFQDSYYKFIFSVQMQAIEVIPTYISSTILLQLDSFQDSPQWFYKWYPSVG